MACCVAEGVLPAEDVWRSTQLEEAQYERAAEAGDAVTELERPFHDELSDWGLFRRSFTVVRNGGRTEAKDFSYICAGSTVRFRKPIEGEGTALMHGDFARKLSPSEEALATYILKHTRLFDGRRVLDVGAGLGFAGLVCGVCARPSYLELTDGDPEVVRTLKVSTQQNAEGFQAAQVAVRRVLWDNRKDWSDRASFDVVVAADVVYLEDLHMALLGMIAHVLRPGGIFVLVASKRNGSLDKFICAAKGFFSSVRISDDYDADVAKAVPRSAKCFPIMVRLMAAEEPEALPQSVVQLCEELSEKRAKQIKEAQREEKHKEKERGRMRAANALLVKRRKSRLLAAKDRQPEEQAAMEAAAAEAAAKAKAAAEKHATLTPSFPEQDGRSDWGLFQRDCSCSPDGSYKEMVYSRGQHSLAIRRPLCGGVLNSDFGRRLSPAEEALALFVAKRRRRFRKKRVLELGAGMGLGGLAAALWTNAKHVELTDGDPNVVATLEANVALNSAAFSGTKVGVRSLLWNETPAMKPFDWILAADVLSQDSSHTALLSTLRRLLKPSGTAVLFASRGASLEAFMKAASLCFERAEVTKKYDNDVSKALHGMACYPHMVMLQRSAKASACPPRPPPSTSHAAEPPSGGVPRAAVPRVSRKRSSRRSASCPRLGPSNGADGDSVEGAQEDPVAVVAPSTALTLATAPGAFSLLAAPGALEASSAPALASSAPVLQLPALITRRNLTRPRALAFGRSSSIGSARLEGRDSMLDRAGIRPERPLSRSDLALQGQAMAPKGSLPPQLPVAHRPSMGGNAAQRPLDSHAGLAF